MLSEETVAAVEAGRFHIYPVSVVEEGIELLTGTPAGTPGDDGAYPEGSAFARVAARLEELRQAAESKKDEDENNKRKPTQDETNGNNDGSEDRTT
jgi:hypothetical protein